jgi:uncharacterized protein with PIN domain
MSRVNCVKVRYRDRIAALLALTRTSDERRPKAERRAYRCPYCRGWHLTSQARGRAA